MENALWFNQAASSWTDSTQGLKEGPGVLPWGQQLLASHFHQSKKVILPCSTLLSLGYFCVGSYPLRQREDLIHMPHVTSEASRSR